MVTFHRRLPRFDYLTPKTIDEALSLLFQYQGRAKVIAGGTDVVPKLKRREIRAKGAEGILSGRRFSEQVIEKAAQTAAEESQPIDDHRASAEYRREMVKVLTRRAINQAISG